MAHDFKKSGQRKERESREKESRRCHFYKKVEHLKKDCYAHKKKITQKGAKPDSTEVIKQCECAKGINVIDTIAQDQWILETQICSVEGVGNIKLKMHDGSCKILADVRYFLNSKGT